MVAIVSSEKALLERIVKAQVASGYTAWKFILEEGDYEPVGEDGEFCSADDCFHVLGVLLDTRGCKKIYRGYWCDDCNSRCPNSNCPFHEPFWAFSMLEILGGWNCGKGNNTYAALMKAVSLLPK